MFSITPLLDGIGSDPFVPAFVSTYGEWRIGASDPLLEGAHVRVAAVRGHQVRERLADVVMPEPPLDRGERHMPSPLARAVSREAVRLAAAGAPMSGNAAQSAPTRPKRLGKWAVIPGVFIGAFLGAAVDCTHANCGPGSPNIPTGVGVGMVAGALTTVFAPRKVSATFLGAGGGFIAGGWLD